MKKQPIISREITPLTPGDCLLVFDRLKSKFDFPIHFHPEYELNFITNAFNAERIVGNHRSLIGNSELVLVGPNLNHGWNNGQCQSQKIHEITIQFHPDLFHKNLLGRNMMNSIRQLLTNAEKGISFSESAIEKVSESIEHLAQKNGIDAFTELIKILNQLSISIDFHTLNNENGSDKDFSNNEQLKKVFSYIEQNYTNKIYIQDIAHFLNMTESTLTRFIKVKTGKSFVNFLNEYRIGFASRWLTETSQSVNEIAESCGFYNISNFNRIFKKIKGCTPIAYRQNFSGTKRVS